MYKRIYEGWSLDEAIKIPIKRKQRILNVKLYMYEGNLMSVKQLSLKYNIPIKNLYKRLNRGWTVDEAVQIPIAKRKEKNDETKF